VQLHRVAKLFPEMTTEQFKDLVADIEKQGQLEPILTCSGKIADGHHRFKACRQLKITPTFVRWEDIRPDKDASLVSYVIGRNLRRRHLTTGQRAAIATRALPLFEAEAKSRQQKAATKAGKASGESRRAKAEEASNVPAKLQERSGKSTKSKESPPKKAPKKPTKKDRERESTAQAAKQAGVSPRYVSEAKALFKKVPELEPLVRSGAIKIPLAKQIAALSLKDARAVIRAGKRVGYKKALENHNAKSSPTTSAEAPQYSERELVACLQKATKQVSTLKDTLTKAREMTMALGVFPKGDGMDEIANLAAECVKLAAEINGK